jgi:hypothetical protein
MRKTRPKFSHSLLCLALLGACASLGCGAACDTSDDANPPNRYAAGTVTSDGYESSPWKAGFLPFPGGKQYQFVHHLGFTPAQVEIFFAFNPDGDRSSPCAGNSCIIRCVDDELIWIENDTCAEFWVRIATSGKSFESRGRACTDGGAIEAGIPIDASIENAIEDVAPDGQSPDVGAPLVDGAFSDQGDAIVE